MSIDQRALFPLQAIALVGLPGCGKTTTGRMLAVRKNYLFADTDEWIERSEKRTIADIFAQDGEEYFRRLERDVLLHLKGKPTLCSKAIPEVIGDDLDSPTELGGLVLATGGGLFVPSLNREILKALSTTIYLRCASATIADRLVKDRSRPLLLKDNSSVTRLAMMAKLEGLLAQRETAYAEAAIVVDTSCLTTESAVDNIEEALSARNQR
ncbi:MAG: shikimate kinase [Cyanobacteria bacterium]|nr:shikimate kinase [Cyanobacteriota bacterium]